jgi:uncharacterized membrane protein
MTEEGPASGARWSDHQVEQLVGNLLRSGVLLAASVTLVGGVFFLLQHGMSRADYHLFASEPAGLRSLAAIISGALHFDSRAVVQLGVVLLIATPIARVMLTLVAFVLQKDRLYTIITTIVLTVLMYSLFFSGRG